MNVIILVKEPRFRDSVSVSRAVVIQYANMCVDCAVVPMAEDL